LETAKTIVIIVIREVFFYEEHKPKLVGIPSLKYDHHLRYSFGFLNIKDNRSSTTHHYVEVVWLDHGILDSKFQKEVEELLTIKDNPTVLIE